MIECSIIYKSISYDPNINMVLGLNFQLESICSNLLSNADNGLYSCSIFLDLL